MTTERLSNAVNVSRLLEDLARQLNSAGINEPFSESREIVAALYDVPRFWPLMNGNLDVDAETLSRARIDLTVEFDDTNNTVAGVYLKLAAAIGDFDWTITGAQRDLTGNTFKVQRTVPG